MSNQNLPPSPTNSIQTIEDMHTTGLYSKRPIAIVRGKGAHLWDSEGNEYIDCVGGQGAANLGHANEVVINAIYQQAQQLISCPEMFYNDKRALLEQKLSQITGLQRVYLCNSGTEAVEAALKFSRLISGKKEIIAAMRGFHGRTFGSLSATWEKKYREPFEPLVPGFKHVPYNDIDALENAVNEDTAAIILEIIQGEGGVRPGTKDYFNAVESICQNKGIIFIIDEVQTGFARSGKMFAHQHFGIKPDILCLGKSIAGGIPMGATLLQEKFGQLPAQVHGSTFGGNPLACASSLAAINYIEQNQLAQKAEQLGTWFIEQLKQIPSPLIREVRGLGLMVGIEIKQKVTPYLQELMSNKVLALPAGLTVMRFLPPLVITQDDLAKVVNAVEKVLSPANNANS